jgi:hypothetical protein
MAFNNKELEIIKAGQQAGKSRFEIEQALLNFRKGVTFEPAPVEPTPVEAEPLSRRLGDVGTRAAEEISGAITGEGRFADQTPLRRGVEATAAGFRVPLEGAFELLPEGVRSALGVTGEAVGAGISALTEQIGETAPFRALAESELRGGKAAGVVEEIAGIGGAAGEIAGNILVADLAAKGGQAIASQFDLKLSKLVDKHVQSARTQFPGDEAIRQGGGTKAYFQAIKDNITRAGKAKGVNVSAIEKLNPATVGSLDDFVRAATPKAGNLLTDAGEGLVQSLRQTASKAKPIGAVAADTNSYIAGRLPKALGIFTGESDDVIRAALKNPEIADIGIARGDAAIREAVERGAAQSLQMRGDFLKGYSLAKQEVLGSHAGKLVANTEVEKLFTDLLKKNKVKVADDGTLDFTTSKIVANPGEVGKIQKAYEALKAWDEFTLSSLDEYKQLVGTLTKFELAGGGTSKSPFLGSLHHELNGIAKTKLPPEVAKAYADVNARFGPSIEMYDDVVKAFHSGDPFSRFANSLGKNKDTLRNTIEFFEKEGGEQILPLVAGRELALEKTAAFGFLNPRSWVDFFISPKAQAKITTQVGRSQGN